MNVAKNKTNKALILFLVSIILITGFVVYSDFIEDKTPLISEFVILKNGVQFEKDFTINEYCSYSIRLFHHPINKRQESISFNSKEIFPADIQIKLYKYVMGEESLIATIISQKPKRIGWNKDSNVFSVRHITLAKGDYRMGLKILQYSKELIGTKLEVSIGFLPNWQCQPKP